MTVPVVGRKISEDQTRIQVIWLSPKNKITANIHRSIPRSAQVRNISNILRTRRWASILDAYYLVVGLLVTEFES